MISTLLALLAFTGWGIGDTLGVSLFRKNKPGLITFYSGLFRVGFWLVLLPFFIKSIGTITLIPLFFNLIAGFSSGLGYFFYGKAARKINPALVAAISGGWGGVALIFSLFFFRERINGQQWLAIGCILIGLLMVTFKKEWLKELVLTKERGIFFAILSLIAWAICGALLKIPALAYGWYWTSLIMLFPYVLILLLEIGIERMSVKFHIKDIKLFLVVVLLTVLADLGYNASLRYGGSIAVVGMIAGSYATLSTFLSYLVYKEPLTKQQVVGIFVALLGIVSTAYFSSI